MTTSQKIHYTKDYSIFSIHPANREEIPKHIKKLKESFSSCDVAHFRPIIVNKEMQILDGQQRFVACKALDMGVYYGVLPEYVDDLEVMIKMNNNQKIWKGKDYLKLYCNKGRPDYILLDRFIKDYKLTLSVALIVINRHSNGYAWSVFREGNFKFPSENEMLIIHEILNVFIEVDNILKSYNPHLSSKDLNKISYIRGMLALLMRKLFPYNKFIKQFKRNIREFHVCLNHESYTRLFKEMFNKGLKERDKID